MPLPTSDPYPRAMSREAYEALPRIADATFHVIHANAIHCTDPSEREYLMELEESARRIEAHIADLVDELTRLHNHARDRQVCNPKAYDGRAVTAGV